MRRPCRSDSPMRCAATIIGRDGGPSRDQTALYRAGWLLQLSRRISTPKSYIDSPRWPAET